MFITVCESQARSFVVWCCSFGQDCKAWHGNKCKWVLSLSPSIKPKLKISWNVIDMVHQVSRAISKCLLDWAFTCKHNEMNTPASHSQFFLILDCTLVFCSRHRSGLANHLEVAAYCLAHNGHLRTAKEQQRFTKHEIVISFKTVPAFSISLLLAPGKNNVMCWLTKWSMPTRLLLAKHPDFAQVRPHYAMSRAWISTNKAVLAPLIFFPG